MSAKLCPIWDHQCYGKDCIAWDNNKCSVIEARKFIPCWPPYIPPVEQSPFTWHGNAND